MPAIEDVKGDVAYVRGLVHRADAPHIASIYVLWAAIVLIGCPLNDLRPLWSPRYWGVAAPAGAGLSMFLGWRWAVRAGQLSSEVGRRHGLHWASLVAAYALAYPLVATGVISWRAFGSLALLLVALTYVLAGIHLQRGLLWVGLLMAVGYLATVLSMPYAWSLAGLVVAAALMAHAVLGGRGNGTAH